MVVINFVVQFEDNFTYLIEDLINFEWIYIANNVTDVFRAKYDRKNLPFCQFGHRSGSSQIIAHGRHVFFGANELRWESFSSLGMDD